MMARAITIAATIRPISSTSTTPCRTLRRRRTELSAASSCSTKASRSSEPLTTRCPCRTFRSGRFLAIYHQDPRVDGGALVQGGADCPVQAVFKVEDAAVFHDVRKEVTEEGGVLGQQSVKVQRALCGHQLIKPDGTRRQGHPVLGRVVSMVRVRASLAHSFKYHDASLGNLDARRESKSPVGVRLWPNGNHLLPGAPACVISGAWQPMFSTRHAKLRCG